MPVPCKPPKRCIECGQLKAASDFWKHNRSADGLFHRCAACCAPRVGPNAVVTDTVGEGFKFCPKCEQTLPKDRFHKHYAGLQAHCKSCMYAGDPNETERQCRKCKVVFPFPDGFHRCLSGYQTICRQCNTDQSRAAKFKKEYGITVQQYEEMVTAQNGVCYLCGHRDTRTIWGKMPRLSVDHDHATGKVRKLLCFDCNQGIGLFKEDIGLLQRVIKYLVDHRDPPVTGG